MRVIGAILISHRLSYLLTTLVAAASIVLLSSVAPERGARGAELSAQSGGCVDLFLLFARGSGQNGENHPLSEQNEFFGDVRSHIPGGLSIREYRLGQEGDYDGYKYPAVSAKWAAAGLPRYGGSVKTGIQELTALLEDRAKLNCPRERWILGGYSQGAHVVGTTIAEKLTEAERSRVAFVALFGDPKLTTTSGKCEREGLAWWVRGDVLCGQRGVHTRGVSSARAVYVPEDMRGRFGSWCDRRDGVCAAGPRRVGDGSHGRYDERMINEAALEASRVVRRLRSSARVCPTFRIASLIFKVTIAKGGASCETARRLLRDTYAGRGRREQPEGDSGRQTYVIRGWRCGTGAGGATCIKGGRTFETAEQRITATVS